MNTCAAELTDGGYRVDYVADQPLTPPTRACPWSLTPPGPLLNRMTWSWCPAGRPRSSPTPSTNDQMLGHVDPTNPPLTLDELGRRLGMAGRTLARHFKAATGLTPQAYVTAARREHATALPDRGWTWQAAARAVGYADARSLRHRD